MIVINLYAGPGAGKSTVAAQLFSKLKWANVNAELVTEYAKDLTWGESYLKLQDQLYVAAHQHHKLFRLKDKVDVAICDSPLLLTCLYRQAGFLEETFDPMILDLNSMYRNIDFLLNRTKPFNQVGRIHTEEESAVIDEAVKNMLDELIEIGYMDKYYELDANENAADIIFNFLTNTPKRDKDGNIVPINVDGLSVVRRNETPNDTTTKSISDQTD